MKTVDLNSSICKQHSIKRL